MRAGIVIPTVRQEKILAFLEVWQHEFENQLVIIVEDNPEPTFPVTGSTIRHFAWCDIDKELGRDAWVIAHRSDCIRSFGYFKAYQENVDIILTLDDDCHPCTPGFLQTHYEALNTSATSTAWVSTGQGTLPRGMPYWETERKLECVINHGLWTNVADFDAITQLASARFQGSFEAVEQTIPRGTYFPMCGMNLAFKPMAVPAMYFLLMGKDWPFDRFGDIWCGILVKKICDHLGYGIKSGKPFVNHQRASNLWANLRKELPGYEVNETFWQAVDSVVLTGTTVQQCYRELAAKLPLRGEYWDQLRKAMAVWSDLFPGA